MGVGITLLILATIWIICNSLYSLQTWLVATASLLSGFGLSACMRGVFQNFKCPTKPKSETSNEEQDEWPVESDKEAPTTTEEETTPPPRATNLGAFHF